ncbi:hypothetical protein HYALB_00002278 [Hymenoscyphus albidus]|uniref:Uncharacterized protein n=1 Tax=Hymenoscyphus albidus TaxID=595503 RepID=A0A9N9Q1J5_9HELO|nr:hypothetical protein HYALB_00002278 [Hymenoscyphus albidus]
MAKSDYHISLYLAIAFTPRVTFNPSVTKAEFRSTWYRRSYFGRTVHAHKPVYFELRVVVLPFGRNTIILMPQNLAT